LTRAPVVLFAAIALTTIGMMLVVAGVITPGLFMPGVILIGIGMLAFAAAAMLHVMAGPAEPPLDAGR
jgi:hypothetical protein